MAPDDSGTAASPQCHLADRGNPFDAPQIAARYESWHAGPGLAAAKEEKRLLRLLMRLLPPIQTVLDVGCGTGRSTRWFTGQDLVATGIDPSDAMLAEAERRGNEQFVKGDAERLPFAANEYDLVSFIISLEFVSDPERAIREAVRVARQGVLLGVQNRHSRLAARRRASGDPIWKRARFFTVSELKRLLRQAMAPEHCSLWWRTTLWPKPISGSLPLPWGGFIGMIAQTPNEVDLPRVPDANMNS